LSFPIRTTARITGGVLAAALVLAGCAAKVNGDSTSSAAPAAAAPASGAGSASGSAAAPAAAGPCTPIKMAMNPWVGFTANAAVVTYVLEKKLKCKVTQTDLKAEISWQGFSSGAVDVIIENWGHPDLVKKYIDTDKTAVNAGDTGNVGHIGWFVNPAAVKLCPGIDTDYKKLNDCADKFATSESGGKGQFLDGDPSFQTIDAHLIENLKLNYKVVYAGSETALIQAFRDGEKNNKAVIGYFYTPQWFLSEVPLVNIKLPKYTEGCDADPAKVACDYPDLKLNKIVSKKLATSGSPAYEMIKKFKWTNDDQNLVAKYITADKMSNEAAAKKWVDANPDKVAAWLS
jgi:glycine betaine/proline transport system substrate-binding protein